MKKISCLFLVIALLVILLPQKTKAQEDPSFYPPTCLYVDPVSLEASWCEPLITALDEDFEDPEFLPPGWQVIPDEDGWQRTDSGSTGNWAIPDWNSYYAVTYDDIDGCCDYLVAPPVDLTENEGYILSFDSFYNGLYGVLAFVEYSTDSCESWEVLCQLTPASEWNYRELNLGAFDGPTGFSQIWFGFHTTFGGWGSGWAIDNIKIQVQYPPADYLDFYVYLDDEMVGTTTETTWNFAPLVYGQSYTAGVKAHYADSLSEGDYYDFTSEYLFPPDSLEAIAPDDAAILNWYPPSDTCCPPSGQLPEGILGYNIYKDQEFLAYTPHNPPGVYTQQGFVEEGLIPGWYEYLVTAVYDLTPYGYPGDSAESVPEGPAVISTGNCFELEFTESWNAETFEDNFWIAEGENWTVSSTLGYPPPSAQFGCYPLQDNYSLPLESYCIYALGMTEGEIWLDFDLKLNTISPPSGLETMNVQVWNWDNGSWSTVAVYNNWDGSFDWTSQHLNITSEAMNSIFRVRFLAEGVHSYDIIGWNIDNIHIYRTCGAPYDLYSVVYPNAIELFWEGPDARDVISYNIYRNINDEGYVLIANVMEMPYRQEGVLEENVYCYMVTAIWESETDQCESEYSNEDCITVGIESLKPDAGFNIYPNPATDNLMIIPGKGISDKEISVSLYNSSGSLIQSEYYRNDKDGEMIINLEKFPSGIYWIVISGDNQIDRSAKFIISR